MILILEDDDLEAMKACSRVWNLALITNRFEKDKDDIVHYLIGPPDYNDIGVAQIYFRKDGDYRKDEDVYRDLLQEALDHGWKQNHDGPDLDKLEYNGEEYYGDDSSFNGEDYNN